MRIGFDQAKLHIWAICMKNLYSLPHLRVAQTALQKGEFQFGGKPVSEFHRFVNGGNQHPSVVMLHAFGSRDSGKEAFEKMCVERAEGLYRLV